MLLGIIVILYSVDHDNKINILMIIMIIVNEVSSCINSDMRFICTGSSYGNSRYNAGENMQLTAVVAVINSCIDSLWQNSLRIWGEHDHTIAHCKGPERKVAAQGYHYASQIRTE